MSALRWCCPAAGPGRTGQRDTRRTGPRSGSSSGSWPGCPVERAEEAVAARCGTGIWPGMGGPPSGTGSTGIARRGDRVVIVSASPELYVRVGRHAASAPTGSSPPASRSSRRRPSPVGTTAPTAAATRSSAACGSGSTGRGTEPGGLWAYGNSRGDLDMLRAADVGVNVGRLGRIGRTPTPFPVLRRTGPDALPGDRAERSAARSQVLLPPHPHQHEPAPDGGR